MSSDDHDPAGPKNEAGGVVPSPAQRVAAARDKSRRGLPVWQESLLLLGLAVVLAVLLKSFVVQAFYIPSESMEPGLVEDDRILVEKWSGWFGGEVERGDVVVFEDPGGWLTRGEVDEPSNPVSGALAAIGLLPDTGFLVKRVVGVEGAAPGQRGRQHERARPVGGPLPTRPESAAAPRPHAGPRSARRPDQAPTPAVPRSRCRRRSAGRRSRLRAR